MKAFTRLAVFAAVALGFAGCAQDVGDINRVQPDFVKKGDFNGEWYIRQTIVDVPPTTAFSFTGMQLDMEKVRWEITENYLVAYRSHELYPGIDPRVDQDGKEIGDTPLDGDLDEGYWGSVDQDGDGRPDGGFYHDAPIAAYQIKSHFDIQRQYNPATGEETNVVVENASDRPWYERAYMRVNWASNAITNYSASVGRESAIDFTSWVSQEQAGSEFGFRIEDADGNPVPVDPTDPAFEGRGEVRYFDFVTRIFAKPPVINYYGYAYPACYFITGSAYDCAGAEVRVRTSVLKVPEVQTFEPRPYDDHRMHKFGFFRTTRQAYDRDRGLPDEGRLHLANVHNIWKTAFTEDGRRIPEAQRTPEPVVYALSHDFPEELIPVAEETAQEWSRAFTRAVAAAQGKDPAVVAAEFPYEDAQGNFVNEGLFRLDYNRDGHAKAGDLRYNFMYWVDAPQISSPLGYGPASPDPETGEIISAQAFVYGASIDTYAQFALDLVDALNGELTLDEIWDGEYVAESYRRNRDRTDPRNRIADLGRQDILDKPLEDLNLTRLDPSKALDVDALRTFGLQEVRESKSARLARLKGTALEPMMINDELRMALGDPGLAQGAPLTDELIAAAEPLTTGLPDTLRLDQVRQNWAAENNIWLADFADTSIEGLARYVQEQQMSRDEARQFLRRRILAGVLEHEVGHTVGLRHNFQGSFDAINFFPEYWELREENLDPSPRDFGQLLDGSHRTPNQIAGRMSEYQYSSIMDYGAKFNSDIHGIGKYDEAAILFGYADHVEVFKDTGKQFRDVYFQRYDDGTPRFENRPSPAYDSFLEVQHYTQVPYLMGNGDQDLGIQRLAEREVVPWETVKSMQEAEVADRYVEVPYMFCSDEWVGVIGSCHRWDEGADQYEQVRQITEAWHNYYWFNNFRRGRWGWSASAILSRSYSRFFSLIPNFYQHTLWNVWFTGRQDLAATMMQISVYEGLNFLSEVLTMPAYGSYVLDQNANAYVRYSYNEYSDANLFVEPGEGRRNYSRYDYDRGYEYYYYPQEAGHFYDYLAALFALSDTEANVLGGDEADFNTYLIPLTLVFEQEMYELFNGIFTEDWRTVSPRLTKPFGGAETVAFKPVVDWLGLYDGDDEFNQNAPIIKTLASSYNYGHERMGWSYKYYTLIYGLIGFNQYSAKYADQHRVFRLGGGEDLTPADGYQVERFENPFNGVVFAALHQTGAEPTAAVQMVRKANAAKAARAEELRLADEARAAGDEATATDHEREASRLMYDIEDATDWMDFQRALYEVFGRVI